MRRIRSIAVIPTLFTLANLVCGFFSIAVTSRIGAPDSGDIPSAAVIQFKEKPLAFLPQLTRSDDAHNAMLAGWLIFLAMVFDTLDGHLARLTRNTTDFGAQLDSLCDVITFGVAPALLLVKMCPTFTYLHREAIWVVAAAYAACVALRLARFNVESDENDDHLHFTGLPCPAAAASIAGFAILFYTLRKETNALEIAPLIDHTMQVALPWFALLVSLLMVSRVPYPHLVNQLLCGHRSFGHVVGLVFSLVAVMVIRGYSVPILCCVFVLGPPVRWGLGRVLAKTEARDPMF